MPRKRKRVIVRMRVDAPREERNMPVSTAIPGTVVLKVDALAKEVGEVRSTFVRRAVEERVARMEAQRATEAA
jgi:predicted transcriptional regulator